MTSPLEEETESLKGRFTRLLSSIEGQLRDIDAVFLTLENKHQVSLNSILDELAVLQRLVCGLSTLKVTKGCPNRIRSLKLSPLVGMLMHLRISYRTWSNTLGVLIFLTQES